MFESTAEKICHKLTIALKTSNSCYQIVTKEQERVRQTNVQRFNILQNNLHNRNTTIYKSYHLSELTPNLFLADCDVPENTAIR